MNMRSQPANIIIFASGTGSNTRNIIERFRDNPAIHIALIVSNKHDAGVLSIASKENIPTLILDKVRFFKGDAYVPELQQLKPSLIVLAGFLWKIPSALVNTFPKKIINIHPALLPKYGGKGMYGNHVHEAVKNAGETETGITIHFVDEQYDHGEHILQAKVPVEPTDTPNSIAQKVHALEYQHLPEVIRQLIFEPAKP